MKNRLAVVSTLAPLLFIGAWVDPYHVHGQTSVKAIVLAWDGAVPSFVQDLLRQNKLPNLAKLIDGGAFADQVTPVLPSTTAPAFTSLWTGAPPRLTGISGNRMPRSPTGQFTILDSVSGFGGAPIRAELLWTPADHAGKHVVLGHGPFGSNRSERIIQFQGYGAVSGREGVATGRNARPRPATGWSNSPQSVIPPLEISFSVGGTRLLGLLIDDPTDPLKGYDTLLVTENKDGKAMIAKLKAGSPRQNEAALWSGAIELKPSGRQIMGTYFRLFDLKPDASDFLLYFTRPTRELTSHPQLTSGAKNAAGAFIGNGASDLYSQGAFGATLPKGGDGLAEARYLETVALVQRQLIATSLWAIENLPWDHFFAYTPFPDEAEHLWRGYLDESLPAFRKEIADRIRPFLEEVYRTCDEYLGTLMAKRPDNTIIALVSDHGMEGVNKLVAINRALQRAGLLATNEQGQVDLTKTKVLYPSINNGYLLINSTKRKDGIVKPEEHGELVSQIRKTLSEIRDGEARVVAAIYDAEVEGEKMGIGGEAGGDLYVDLLPGYDFNARTGPGDLVVRREPMGSHGFHPGRPSMRTLMVLNGPGVAAGRRLRDVRLIDFAPTFAELLGMPGPKDAIGRVLQEAFSAPR